MPADNASDTLHVFPRSPTLISCGSVGGAERCMRRRAEEAYLFDIRQNLNAMDLHI